MEAEQRAEACLRLGMEVGDADALGWYGAELVAIRWFQGRGGEVLPTVVEMSQSTTVAELNHGFVAAIAARLRRRAITAPPDTGSAGLRANGLRSVLDVQHLDGHPARRAKPPTCSTTSTPPPRRAPVLRTVRRPPVMASLGAACFGSVNPSLALAA